MKKLVLLLVLTYSIESLAQHDHQNWLNKPFEEPPISKS